MNTQLQNYLNLQSKVNRIEKLLGGDWEVKYFLDKFVPAIWNDGFDVDDIQDYIAIKLQEAITRLEEEEKIITTNKV